MLALSPDQRPPAVERVAEQYLPSILHVLTGLKDAYAAKKEMESRLFLTFGKMHLLCVSDYTCVFLSTEEEEEEEDSDDDGVVKDSDRDVNAVDSDTDVIDEESNRYLELLEAVVSFVLYRYF